MLCSCRTDARSLGNTHYCQPDSRPHRTKWQVAANMVSATLDIYNTIADNLLPTPAKSHYTFNLRDLSKVFQVSGVYLAVMNMAPLRPPLIGQECRKFARPSTPSDDVVRCYSSLDQGVLQGSSNLISEKEQFVRLWSHECLRIFHDRLVDDSDRVWFNHMLEEKVSFMQAFTPAEVQM